jgi:hypothetical protein
VFRRCCEACIVLKKPAQACPSLVCHLLTHATALHTTLKPHPLGNEMPVLVFNNEASEEDK